MDDELILKRWNNWLDTIYNDVQGILANRYVYQEVGKIIQANPDIQIGSAFYAWMEVCYITTQATGVRRQADIHKDSASFVNLLGEIIEHPQILPNIISTEVNTDLSELKQTAKPMRQYVNKRIAHFDKSDLNNLPTYAELDSCLNFIEKLLKKYLRLFKGKHYPNIVPVFQYNWKEIFEIAWIKRLDSV
jgi:hypothetical protein